MNEQNTRQQSIEPTSVIEDLTLAETEMESVKGGPVFMPFPDIDGEVRVRPASAISSANGGVWKTTNGGAS